MAKRTGTPIINWNECIICQKHSNKEKTPTCPANSKRPDLGAGFRKFVSDIESWNAVVEPSRQFDLSKLDDGNGALQSLFDNKGKWHKSCRIKYGKLAIERQPDISMQHDPIASTSNDDESSQIIRSSTRSIALSKEESLQRNRSQCCFCKCGESEEDGQLHAIQTTSATDKIKSAAELKNDEVIYTRADR